MEKINMITEIVRIPECVRIPKVIPIQKVVSESFFIKTFYFKHPEIAKMAMPGQFIMLGVYNYLKPEDQEEIPLSLSYINIEDGMIGVTVKKAGKTTEALLNHKTGDEVTIRGPYGHGFEIKGSNVAVIGGGIGIAPLVPLIEKLRERNINVLAFLGAQTSSELIFVKRIEKTGAKIILTTDDGSEGKKGNIVDAFKEILESMHAPKFDQIMVCGREVMMKKVLNLAEKYNIPAQLSLERLIRCGRGICGHCAIDGYRVCKDGPVFSSEVVSKMKDFGKRQLNESGASSSLTF